MKKFLKFLSIGFTVGCILVVASVLYIAGHYSKDLPDHEQLRKYNPSITTRLYSGDGLLLKEYAEERRLFVPIEHIPELVKNAFIAPEDANFYNHPGIDFKALTSAVIFDIGAIFTGAPMRGASTITQQVAKNFLLTKDKTFERKIKEAILSFRMTQAFTKDEVLELYLNQIYLGNRSYGIASAALNYFDKSLDELTVEEAAMLGALPKAPGKINPLTNYARAMERRNWVLKRMYLEKFISEEQYELAKDTEIVIKERAEAGVISADYFAEEVRKQLVNMYGEESVLVDGRVVTTTLNPRLQKIADKALKNGIEEYDLRHGWRGALGNIKKGNKEFKNKWYIALDIFEIEKEYRNDWEKAVILEIDNENERVEIGLPTIKVDEVKTPAEIDEINNKIESSNNFVFLREEGIVVRTGYIYLKDLQWARAYIDIDTVGGEIDKPSYVKFKKGDIIMVQKLGSFNVKLDKKDEEGTIEEQYALKQIPEVNGSVVIMDPHNGRVLSMMGGYLDSAVAFNRATQAERQPGSILKTFGYLAALENGFSPADIIMDEEIELDQGLGYPPYKPHNYSEKFYGPTTLRIGLEKSRNVATVRLASEIGLDKVTEVIKRFGINEHPNKIYSIVLGSTETNLIKLTNAYAMIVNGGKVIKPSLIERIQDKNGHTVYRRDSRTCIDCLVVKDEEDGKHLVKEMKKIEKFDINKMIFPDISDFREEITDSATAYQMTSMLEGVVQRGTGWKAKRVRKVLGGKTGTTNNVYDAWFVGFSPDLVVGVYIGYDEPRTLGKNETGSSVALPIFVDIMTEALEDEPSIPFRVPSTIKLVKIDRITGRYPTPNTTPKDIIYEAFKVEDVVSENKEVALERDGDDEFNEYLDDVNQEEEMLEFKKDRIENREEVGLEDLLDDLGNGVY